MSNIDDFKSLWSQQPAPEKPDPGVLISKAVGLRNKMRSKLLLANLICLATGVFIVYIWMNIDPKMITTRIGIIVTLTGILAFVLATAGILQPLYKSREQSSNADFLDQMIRFKKGQDFMHKIFMNIYFFLISAGVLLYMYEFAMRMTWVWATVCYAVTIGWMGFNWLYLKPKTAKKQSDKLNKMISELEEINQQITD
ncbi:hypothetical protein GVN16_07465 [Emticicia sp. CRIBPO]|uniref:hypothetical protein n=1 Tax=Emticicia sp. CRIBPO TaxID=2683258 RepID=UPI001411F239|nr:hypothetical protein [Emticicia sp. CRIBPO]NBA85593.1 hypothetical protein [Emticicia sp. CRIBPO]